MSNGVVQNTWSPVRCAPAETGAIEKLCRFLGVRCVSSTERHHGHPILVRASDMARLNAVLVFFSQGQLCERMKEARRLDAEELAALTAMKGLDTPPEQWAAVALSFLFPEKTA